MNKSILTDDKNEMENEQNLFFLTRTITIFGLFSWDQNFKSRIRFSSCNKLKIELVLKRLYKFHVLILSTMFKLSIFTNNLAQRFIRFIGTISINMAKKFCYFFL